MKDPPAADASSTPSKPRAKFPFALVILLAGAAIFGVGAALLVLSYSQQQSTIGSVPLGASALLRVGKAAPEFSLKTLDGAGTVSLAQLRGKRVLINFWASWCTPCIEETPALIEAYRQLNDPSVAFVAIGLQDDLARLKKFADDNGVPYLVVSDGDGAVGDAYAVRGLPTTILIDSSGIVQNIVSGPVQRDKVVDLIGQLR